MSTLPAQTTAKKTVKEYLESTEIRNNLAKALPKHMSPDRQLRVMFTTMNKIPKLKDCTLESLGSCLLQLSAIGLEPDGREAHLIPFRDNRSNTTVCTLIIDYKGMVKLALNSGKVSSIHADKVCEADQFEVDRGRITQHKIDYRKPRGDAYAYYALITFKDGGEKSEVMTFDEVQDIRKRSKSPNAGPWVTDFSEMGKKGLALDTPIPTPSGWTSMGELNPGDFVFDMHGKPTSVIAVSEVKRLQCFKVNFTNGDSIICDDEHRWLARCGKASAWMQQYEVTTVNDLYDAKMEGLSITVPVQGTLQTPDAVLPIEPYLLGYWLGDGTSRAAAITCWKEDLKHVSGMIEGSKYTLGKVKFDPRSEGVCVRIKDGLLEDLRALGVLANKHVPAIYLRASERQRTALLAGLMDSDGHIDKERGRCHFYNKNQNISDAVSELVSSLGDVPQSGIKMMKGFGIISKSHFVGWKPSVCPCRLERKAANFQPRKISKYRAIGSIEMIASVPTKCITVDNESSTYLAGRSMAPTHNSVFKRASKWIPQSPELRDALEADDEPTTQVTTSVPELRVLPMTPEPDDVVVEAQEVPEASPEPPQETISAKDELAEWASSHGVSFDQFLDAIAMAKLAEPATASMWDNYQSIPSKDCEAILRKHKQILVAFFAKVKGGGK